MSTVLATLATLRRRVPQLRARIQLLEARDAEYDRRRDKEASKSVGSSSEVVFCAIWGPHVEETGIPALELHPQRVVEHPGSGLKHKCAPRFDQRICWRFAKRFPTTALTVDSANAVETRSP